MNCYNCGIELTNETNHVEHIPAKNLFKTYPDEYKKNLLTIPACYDCNIGLYSKIDHEIRDAIGILNEKDDLKNEMTEKAVRSIMRKSNWKERVFSIDGGTGLEVSFSYDDIEKLHIKNFKGLFYSKYGHTIPDNYEIRIIAEGDEENEKLQRVNDYFREYIDYEMDWSFIGHPEVFKYKIKAMIPGEDDMFYDGDNLEEAIGFVCTMEYHGALKPLVIAQTKEFIDEE